MTDPLPVLPLHYPTSTNPLPSRWGRVLVVAVLCMLLAWLVGAGTNAINGYVSLFYFQTIVGWMYGQMTIADVIWQGLMESTVFGVILMVVFTTTYAASTAARCKLRDVMQILFTALIVTLAFWAIGGVFGLIWASVEPLSFKSTFDAIPDNVPSLRAWGWVGGSIWGIYAGGILTIICGPIVLHFRWRQLRDRAARSATPDL